MGRPRVRDKIVVAARELLQAEGAAALTTRAVAQYAGVTEASVFNNFGDKAGLVRALVEEQLPQFEHFRQALAANPEPLESWLCHVLLAAREHFCVVLPLAAPHLLQAPPKNRKPSNSYSAQQLLAQRLDALKEAQLIDKSVDTEAASLLIMGAAMHIAMTELTRGDDALGRGGGQGGEQSCQRLAATFLQQITKP